MLAVRWQKKLYKICKFFNNFAMEIIEVASGQKKQIMIRPVEDEDFKILTKKRYSFAWKSVKGSAIIYKLQIGGTMKFWG